MQILLSAIDLLFRLIFNLAIKYGDIVNRSISFVATSSNPLKGQLQRKISRFKEKQSYLMQNAQYKTVFVKSEQPGPEKDCRFLWSFKNVEQSPKERLHPRGEFPKLIVKTTTAKWGYHLVSCTKFILL